MCAYHIHLADVKQRAHAALLGAAIGDAMGATLEFMTPGEIRARFGVLREIRGGGWLHLPKGAVTDDTEMTLCIARSLVKEGWSPRDIAERFAAWLKSRPRDVGGTCRRGIRRFMTEGSLATPPNEADAGNGAAMRMAPIALATLADDDLLNQWAKEQAHITHNHPLSDAGCVLVGRLIHLACIGHSMPRLRACADAAVARYPQFRFAGRENISSAYIVDTMKTVLKHLFSTRNFEDCVVDTINDGGDADTAGAIVGAIAGSYYGLEAIPSRWIAALSPALVAELDALANGLVALAPISRDDAASKRRTREVA